MAEVQVFHCGGVVVYQLLCGEAIAQGNKFATQMKNFCYLIVNTLDRTAITVDAAWDVVGILALAERLEVQLRGGIYTHFHFDHCGGNVDPAFVGRKIPPLAGAKDIEEAGGQIWAGEGDAGQIAKQCGLKEKVVPLQDGSIIECGDLMLHILNTPGHTPGSVSVFAAPRCLSPRSSIGQSPFKEKVNKADGGLLFTGDTLFPGSVGRTDFPGGDQRQMLATMSRLSTMDESVVVCPGHGYAPEAWTTIGRERVKNESMIMGIQMIPKPTPLPACVACGTGRACGPLDIPIGRRVRIQGLTSDAGQAMNGCCGVIQSFDADKGRYGIKLIESLEEKLLKPDNLEGPSLAAPAGAGGLGELD